MFDTISIDEGKLCRKPKAEAIQVRSRRDYSVVNPFFVVYCPYTIRISHLSQSDPQIDITRAIFCFDPLEIH